MNTTTTCRALALTAVAALVTTALPFAAASAAVSGDTATIAVGGASTPGLTKTGTVTVTAPDSSPVAGEEITLSVDHGFFTTGDPVATPVEGAMAGDLEQLGTTLTDTTDANGQIDFELGIARDAGFDDDGVVTATVSAAGSTATATATWSTATTLNGRVAVTLTPTSGQENPVAPALAGNRTFYDVFALDQFGNRFGGAPIDLSYPRLTKDYDYSDDFAESDFDVFGDITVTSFVAGEIDLLGTWEDAPSYRYDAMGDAQHGTTTVSGGATASTYELAFGASRFSITSSATDTVRVGTTVTSTVRVIDQQGNPVVGYQVRFLRFGPDEVRGDVVASETTNALGEAFYTFVGTRRGFAKITAEVTDGRGRRLLASSTAFGASVRAKLVKGKNGPGRDRLRVTTRTNVTTKNRALTSGARVQVYRIDKGQRVLVATKRLGTKGTADFSIRDRNRSRSAKYVAVVRSTSRSVADQSNSVAIR